MPGVQRVIDKSELAFEEDIVGMPVVLWRVYSRRPWNDRSIRHVNYFATEEAAMAHAEWISDGRGKVIAVGKYELA